MKVVRVSPFPPLWAGCPEQGSAEGLQGIQKDRTPTPPSPQAPGCTAGLIRRAELGQGTRFNAGALASCFTEGLPSPLA